MFELMGDVDLPSEHADREANPDPLDPLDPLDDWALDWPLVRLPEHDDSGSLGGYEPCAFLGVELDAATTDVTTLSDTELIETTIGLHRMIAWTQARQSRVLAEFAARRGEDPTLAAQDKACGLSPYAPDEIGLALHQSRGTAVLRIRESIQLTRQLPATLALWEQGLLDHSKIKAICAALRPLRTEIARDVEARVLPRAAEWTLGQLRAGLARAIIAVDPAGATERHTEARKDRRVELSREREGMASLWALMTAPDATASYEWLSRLARSLGIHDTRSMDARRADLMAALLTGRLTITDPAAGPSAAFATTCSAEAGTDGSDHESSRVTPIQITRPPATPGKPLIHIVMPYTTLTGTDDQPCDLAGYGPIPAQTARDIAADSVWRRLVTDPTSGTLLDVGRTSYRPPAALADFVRARDLHCRSPICQRRALNCELDHNHDWTNGGNTTHTNLAPLCPHDHHLKHDHNWTVTQHSDSRMEWHTPTGHTYTSEPHDYRPEPRYMASPKPPEKPEPTTTRVDWEPLWYGPPPVGEPESEPAPF